MTRLEFDLDVDQDTSSVPFSGIVLGVSMGLVLWLAVIGLAYLAARGLGWW